MAVRSTRFRQERNYSYLVVDGVPFRHWAEYRDVEVRGSAGLVFGAPIVCRWPFSATVSHGSMVSFADGGGSVQEAQVGVRTTQERGPDDPCPPGVEFLRDRRPYCRLA